MMSVIIKTTPVKIDDWNPTHRNGKSLGMLDPIALLTIDQFNPTFFVHLSFISYSQLSVHLALNHHSTTMMEHDLSEILP